MKIRLSVPFQILLGLLVLLLLGLTCWKPPAGYVAPKPDPFYKKYGVE